MQRKLSILIDVDVAFFRDRCGLCTFPMAQDLYSGIGEQSDDMGITVEWIVDTLLVRQCFIE